MNRLPSELPTHIGFIVDGNRRWAKERGLTSYRGHLEGYKVLKELSLDVIERGVKYVSAYVFSTENWKRSNEEIGHLMSLVLRLVAKDLNQLQEKNIRVRILGSRDNVPKNVQKALDKAEAATKDNSAGTLALCFNYGGQAEITDAVKAIVRTGAKAEDITPELIADNLYGSDIPACDLIVRTSGEQRLSNFMLWRAAYSELLFMDKNWPDMTKQDVTDILEEYQRRTRRFGK
ncbi:MAG TPA: polyprenyl diphosphate synthase [Candidatus Saccharibacteria bacterium]|nr:polyprenyl diphosphate synthase [Candidatus Saccharibacteria bacterium]HRK94338.1 polyprenyl diphosphate synthase [Candidatus Saccharibacteria bacterium]